MQAPPTHRTHVTATVPPLAVEEAGDGPPVLFLHGIGGNRANWAPQLAGLSRSYRCISLDFRGYGGSGDVDERFDFHDLVHDAAEALDLLGVRSCHIVGLSMGGLVAQAFYARSPDRVRSLCLAACRPGSAPSFDAASDFTAQRLAPLETGGPDALADALLPRLLGAEVTPAAKAAIRDSLLRLQPTNYRIVLAARQRIAPFLDPGRIAVPTLVVAGTEDKVAPLGQMRDLAAAIPGARLAVLQGAGHLCNIEQPNRFNALLTDFLSGPASEPTRNDTQ